MGAIEEFIRAFNERDLDGFVATLHPEVEIHGMRGLRTGVEEAREWATRPQGGVQQEILLDEIVEQDDTAVALIRRRMYWDEDGTEAGVDVMAWLFELEDGRVRLWKPYGDRDEALRAAGLSR